MTIRYEELPVVYEDHGCYIDQAEIDAAVIEAVQAEIDAEREAGNV